jgi:hypothetical protein
VTKTEAKRWVCERVRGSLVAGLVEDEANELLPADQARVKEAVDAMVVEMDRRAKESRTDS